ncbi:MAG TPA: NAD-dependent epimerase/dehydratase family protein, partial [Candidatus Aminicenantes bacterium]|nr:NAD-dependent epimerase/dehydratase family protein [Candidatus Aminicenantes bacterium]
DYHRQNKVETKIARIFNSYGPRMALNDGRVISNFIIQSLKGEPLTVYGQGKQTRSFCYVDDIIEGLIQLMNTNSYPYPLNLGNPEEITIIELAKMIIDLTQSSSSLQFQPLPPDDPQRRCPDITKAKKILNWEPRTELDSGLKATIQYFQEILSKS